MKYISLKLKITNALMISIMTVASLGMPNNAEGKRKARFWFDWICIDGRPLCSDRYESLRKDYPSATVEETVEFVREERPVCCHDWDAPGSDYEAEYTFLPFQPSQRECELAANNCVEIVDKKEDLKICIITNFNLTCDLTDDYLFELWYSKRTVKFMDDVWNHKPKSKNTKEITVSTRHKPKSKKDERPSNKGNFTFSNDIRTKFTKAEGHAVQFTFSNNAGVQNFSNRKLLLSTRSKYKK